MRQNSKVVTGQARFCPPSTNIASKADDVILRALRRGVAQNRATELSLVSRKVEGYDRALLVSTS